MALDPNVFQNLQAPLTADASHIDPWEKASQIAKTMQSLKLLGAGQPYMQTGAATNADGQ